MIGIGRTTKGSVKAIAYASREEKGRENEYATEISRYGLVGDTPEAIYKELMTVAELNHRVSKPFYNVVLSPLSENTLDWKLEDWEKLVDDFLSKKQLSENQHIAYLHQDTNTSHLHLIVNRIDFNGINKVNQRFIGIQTSNLANELAKDRGWLSVQDLTKEKNLQKVKLYGDVLKEALKESNSLGELEDQLQKKGYGLNLQFDQNSDLKGLKIFQFEEAEENKKRKDNKQKPLNIGVKFSELSRGHNDFKKLKAISIQNYLEQKAEVQIKQQEAVQRPKNYLRR